MQRLLATACAVTLAIVVPAIELEDIARSTAGDTAARHDGSARQDNNEAAAADLNTRAQPAVWDGRDAHGWGAPRHEARREAAYAIAPIVVVEPVPQPNISAPDLVAADLPSLAALDDAFDVPYFPALAALDAAFDNRRVELPPVPVPVRRPPTDAEMCDSLAVAAAAHNLPPPFLIRLIWQESRFHHNVVSHAGAQGIAQFMPATASYMGLDDPFNPLEALPMSARFLQKLIERFGNIGLAAAAYNAGPKRVLDWLANKGKLPQETQDYVKTVTGQPAEDWRKREATASLPRVPQRAPCQREAGLHAADGPDRVPLPPDRNSGKVLVAAADKKPDAKTTGDKTVDKAPAKAVQLAAMRNVKSKTKGKTSQQSAAQKKAEAKTASAAPPAKPQTSAKDASKAPKKIAAATKR